MHVFVGYLEVLLVCLSFSTSTPLFSLHSGKLYSKYQSSHTSNRTTLMSLTIHSTIQTQGMLFYQVMYYNGWRKNHSNNKKVDKREKMHPTFFFTTLYLSILFVFSSRTRSSSAGFFYDPSSLYLNISIWIIGLNLILGLLGFFGVSGNSDRKRL